MLIHVEDMYPMISVNVLQSLRAPLVLKLVSRHLIFLFGLCAKLIRIEILVESRRSLELSQNSTLNHAVAWLNTQQKMTQRDLHDWVRWRINVSEILRQVGCATERGTGRSFRGNFQIYHNHVSERYTTELIIRQFRIHGSRKRVKIDL